MVALCSFWDLKSDVQQSGENADDAALRRAIADASDDFQRATGRTYVRAVNTQQVIGGAQVIWGRDRILLDLPMPRITAVTAVSLRAGTPAAGWTALDLSLVEWETVAPASEISSTVRVWGRTGARPDGGVWAQVSYTAGWLCDFPVADSDPAATDPPPASLQSVVRWWAQWYYRKKDAPYGKTANPLTGTVTIPLEMPVDIERALCRWKAPWVV